ncbi:MAG: cobalamin-dependent protein [Eubacteriales bacterium]
MKKTNLPIDDFQTSLLKIDRIKAAEIFENIYLKDKNFETLEYLTMEALERIGDGWEDGQLSLSQVYMSGVICEELIEKYIPKYNSSYKNSPKIAIGVLQDHHALGKRIVYSLLRAGGYNLLDFGQGLSAEEIVDKTIESDLDFLLISTLMLPSALKVKNIVKSLRENGSNTKVIVGGAPFRLDEHLWKKVDAYAHGKNGTEAKKIIEKISKGGH